MNILLVEYDDLIRKIMEGVLARTHTVTAIKDATKALPHLERSRFDAVVLDHDGYFSDIINGAELSKAIRSKKPRIRVILTVNDTVPDEHSADAVLIKPFAPSELEKELTRKR